MPFGRKKTMLDRAQEYVDSVTDTVRPHVEAAIETAQSAARDAADKAGPALEDARAKAAPVIADAREKAVPLAVEKAQEARAKAAPVIAEGRARAGEAAAAGAALAAAKAADGRELAAAKLAEVKGEPEPKGGGKLKKLLLVGGLAALGGFLYSKLKGQSAGDNNWQTSYVPSPPPSGATNPAAPGAPTVGSSPTDTMSDPLNDPMPGASAGGSGSDDSGGAGPGEALTDSHAAPREATTPDSPAETVDVDGSPEDDAKA